MDQTAQWTKTLNGILNFFRFCEISWFYCDDSSESKLRISRFVDWSLVSRAIVWHVKGKYFSIITNDDLQNHFAVQCTLCTLHWIKSSIYMKYYYLLVRSFHWLCLTLTSISSSASVSWPWSRMIEHSSTLEFRQDGMKNVNNKLLDVVCGIRWGRSVCDFYSSNKICCILGPNLLPSSHPPWCTGCWPRC